MSLADTLRASIDHEARKRGAIGPLTVKDVMEMLCDVKNKPIVFVGPERKYRFIRNIRYDERADAVRVILGERP